MPNKKTNWFKKEDLAERENGMYTLEKKRVKYFFCCYFTFFLAFYLVWSALYADRSTNAARINTDLYWDDNKFPAYDVC